MEQNQLLKKIGKLAIIVGAVSLILSLICFIVLGVASAKIEEEFGYEVTADEIGDIIEDAEKWLKWLDGDEIELKDVAEYVGISASELTFVQMSLALKIPSLVIGLIALVVGIALVWLTKNPDKAGKVGETVTTGTAAVASVATNTARTIANVTTVKCENCGKTHVSGTKFCSNCGSQLNQMYTVQRMGKCPVCESTILGNSKFCSVCGTAIGGENVAASASRERPTSVNSAVQSTITSKQNGVFHQSDDLD